MLIDAVGLSALSVVARANAVGQSLGTSVAPAQQAGVRSSTPAPAANASAGTIGGSPTLITIGPEGLQLLQAPPDSTNDNPENERRSSESEANTSVEKAQHGDTTSQSGKNATGDVEKGPDGLTDEGRAAVQQLQQRDAEVKRHERAHQAAGGRFAGAATYQYETGPDGRSYAVGGEVSIDASAVPGDPQATLEKARTIRRAALAPANPSAQDLRVANQAVQLAAQAQADIRAERAGERQSPPEETKAADRNDSPVDDGNAASVSENGENNASRILEARQAFGNAIERTQSRSPNGPDVGVALFNAEGGSMVVDPVTVFA